MMLRILSFLLALAALSSCDKQHQWGRDVKPLAPAAAPEIALPAPAPYYPPIHDLPVDTKLFAYWENEIADKSPAEVSAMNDAALAGLDLLPSVPGAQAFSPTQASEFHRQLMENIVTNDREKYEQPGTSIGYCFGRAMFVHLLALKSHYKKAQIRKLWAVGPMDAGGLNWAFHVATVIRDGGSGPWRVVDSYMRKSVSPGAWLSVFLKQNPQGTLRLYVTPAEKFTPDLGKYSREELGLDLPADRDWYRHYFSDLMGTLKIRDVLHGPEADPAEVSPQIEEPAAP